MNSADTNGEQITTENDLEHKSDDSSNDADKNEKVNDATNEKDDVVTNGKDDDDYESDGEETEEVYEVETIRDYSYCKVSVSVGRFFW